MNGITGLVVTKLDVLDGIDPIRICVGYTCAGAKYDVMPSGLEELRNCQPIYEDHPGWSIPTAGCRNWDDLPVQAQSYIRRIEELTDVPVAVISTGQERTEYIELIDPWKG
jgi:adenylosuccinate synthase